MPSEKILLAKKEKVAALTDAIKNSAAGVLVDYRGITVEEDTKLRKELREAGVSYSVEKNSMLRFALKDAGYDELTGVLEGTTAIAISNDDQTAPARILGKFAEEHADKFNLKAGYIGEEIYDVAGVTALSKIPSKEVLLARLVGSLQGPITGLAAILKAVQDSKESEVA
ncbi:MAG: 50S ribosomal protein L10 [Ruminococcus sp.]|nr:50S ribosomal protein L10 [Ruminococcus sp.]